MDGWKTNTGLGRTKWAMSAMSELILTSQSTHFGDKPFLHW